MIKVAIPVRIVFIRMPTNYETSRKIFSEIHQPGLLRVMVTGAIPVRIIHAAELPVGS
jgi:hypothetical protein